MKFQGRLLFIAGLVTLSSFSLVIYNLNLSHPAPREHLPIDWSGGKDTLLVYNRVPKSGSGSMLSLLRHLQYKNNFTLIEELPGSRRPLPNSSQEKFVASMAALPRPTCIVAHFAYMNFTEFVGYASATYMNMIRDPVSTFVSGYFFRRIRHIDKADWSEEVDKINTHMQKCYLQGDPECRYLEGSVEGPPIMMPITYFCGSQDVCSIKGSEDALNKAKRAVESEYKVVGILEDLNMTITVLEHLIPKFFKGARHHFETNTQVYVHEIDKSKVEHELAKIRYELKGNMSKEYELYEFAKQRLHRQYAQLVSSDPNLF